MIIMIGLGVAFLVVVAVVVGIVDSANASSWRRVAAERRMRWERAYHGAPGDPEGWDED